MVTSVTLTCPGQHEQSATPGQSSGVTIPALSPSDNGLQCVCSGRWEREKYYNLTDSRTLTVYCELMIAVVLFWSMLLSLWSIGVKPL